VTYMSIMQFLGYLSNTATVQTFMKNNITKQVILATKSITWLRVNQRQKMWYLRFAGGRVAED